jgi:hypothetical protein
VEVKVMLCYDATRVKCLSFKLLQMLLVFFMNLEMDSTYRCHHMERVVPGLFWRAGGQSPDGGYFPTEVHKYKIP